MKKIIAILSVICLLCCLTQALATEEQADITVNVGCNTLDGQMPYLGSNQLVKNGKAMLLYEANTDTLLYAYNADTQLPPASLVKILTALIAIEKGSMTDVVTVSAEVLSTLDSDAMVTGLHGDEVLTVQDLLYCMMVDSGNDAAVILADHVMGDQTKFVLEMNRYAAELGCTGTNFTNVHGLHDNEQYTTARDVAKILSKAIQNSQFCELFGAKKYVVPATNKSEARELASGNYLMTTTGPTIYFDERATGSRTGRTYDDTQNIASTAQVGDMKLIAVVMGAESVYDKDGYTVKVFGGYDETRKLFDLGFNGNKTVQVLHKNQILRQAAVVNGSADLLIGTQEEAFSVVPEGLAQNELQYRYINEASLTAPIEKGQRVSTLQIWYNQVCIAEAELYAMNTVAVAGTEFSDNTKAGTIDIWKILSVVFGVILAAALLCLTVFLLIRARRRVMIRRQSIRNRRNRRRSR